MDASKMLSIKNIIINEFKDIRHCNLDSIPTHAPWIFLTGENGMGKTVFLQAIATALHPIDNQINDTQSGIGEYGHLEVGVYNCRSYGVMRNLTSGLVFKDGTNFKCLSCYGPSRLQTLTESAQNERVDSLPGINRLSWSPYISKKYRF